MAWQVEELLIRLAGEESPAVSIGDGEISLRATGGSAWYQGDEEFWKSIAPGESEGKRIAERVGDKWVALEGELASLRAFCDSDGIDSEPEDLTTELFRRYETWLLALPLATPRHGRAERHTCAVAAGQGHRRKDHQCVLGPSILRRLVALDPGPGGHWRGRALQSHVDAALGVRATCRVPGGSRRVERRSIAQGDRGADARLR